MNRKQKVACLGAVFAVIGGVAAQANLFWLAAAFLICAFACAVYLIDT